MWMGRGMSASVVSSAYPNMRPWSPAPSEVPWSESSEVPERRSNEFSTPALMSEDCAPIDTDTPQLCPSKPLSEES